MRRFAPRLLRSTNGIVTYHPAFLALYCIRALPTTSRSVQINEYQKRRFSEKMVAAMMNTVTGKKIAVFGFAFKKDTGDTRETASAFICRDLLEEQAKIHVYDPQVKREQVSCDKTKNR